MNTLSVAGDVAPLALEQRKGGVAFLTLNRPAQYNALSDEMFLALRATLDTLTAAASVAPARAGGRTAAYEMLVTGEFIDAAPALQRALINRCVPAERLDQEISRLAMAIAAKPPSVIATGKALFYRQLEADVGSAYRLAGEAMACNMIDEIAQEGVAAFIEKRSPNWGPD